MFKVMDKETGDVFTVYGTEVRAYDRHITFLVFIDNRWLWVSSDAYMPYEAPVSKRLNNTDEFVLIKVFVMIEGDGYEEFYVRKTMDNASEFIKAYIIDHSGPDGEWIPNIEDIKFDKASMTVAQLRAFLTVDEFAELESTGKVGDI